MKVTNNETKVYTVKDIQEILLLSKNAVYALISDSPPFKVFKIGNTYRIPKGSFDKWLESQD